MASGDDVFQVGQSLRIHNPALNLDVIIHSPFIKELERNRSFVSLDFYKSRGVYALLSSRLPKKNLAKRPYTKVLSKVVGKLKCKRDEEFRKAIQGNVPGGAGGVNFRGRSSVKLKTKKGNCR